MSTTVNYNNRKTISEILELIKRHFITFAIEDFLFQYVTQLIPHIIKDLPDNLCKNTGNFSRCLNIVNNLIKDHEIYFNHIKRTFYSKSNEPVRLGAFRVLFREVYMRIHGDVTYRSPLRVDLSLHGILREELKVLHGLKTPMESYHVGIDYVSLIDYPDPTGKRRVVVPLFIIAKSESSNLKGIKLKEAVKLAKRLLDQTRAKNNSVRLALENIPNFTRIILMKAPYKKSEVDRPCITEEEREDIPVYVDMLCAIINLVFYDIPRMYQMVIENTELAKLTMEDWLKALLMLAVPVLQIDTASANKAPNLPGTGGLSINVNDIVKEARQKIIGRAAMEIRYHTESVEKLVNQAKALLEQHLINLIKQHKYRKRNTNPKRRKRMNYATW